MNFIDDSDEYDPCNGCDLACSGCAFEHVPDRNERKRLDKIIVNMHSLGGVQFKNDDDLEN